MIPELTPHLQSLGLVLCYVLTIALVVVAMNNDDDDLRPA